MGTTEYAIDRSDEEYAELVDVIDSFGKGLDEWEIGFIANLIDNPPLHYSPKRRQIIERLYDKKL